MVSLRIFMVPPKISRSSRQGCMKNHKNRKMTDLDSLSVWVIFSVIRIFWWTLSVWPWPIIKTHRRNKDFQRSSSSKLPSSWVTDRMNIISKASFPKMEIPERKWISYEAPFSSKHDPCPDHNYVLRHPLVTVYTF
jgi:hypothetical protein